jgi:hypothetical protein
VTRCSSLHMLASQHRTHIANSGCQVSARITNLDDLWRSLCLPSCLPWKAARGIISQRDHYGTVGCRGLFHSISDFTMLCALRISVGPLANHVFGLRGGVGRRNVESMPFVDVSKIQGAVERQAECWLDGEPNSTVFVRGEVYCYWDFGSSGSSHIHYCNQHNICP